MVVQVDNPANKNMHYGDRVLVTDLEVPDKLPQKFVYSNSEANKKFIELENDIYEKQQAAAPLETTKTPMIIKILLGVGVSAALLFKGKTIFKALKNILTR